MKDNDRYEIILSNDIINILNRIKHPISDKLLFLNKNTDYGFPFSFIDIHNENEISYTPSKKVIELVTECRYKDFKNMIWTTSRSPMRIGRLVTKIIGGDSKLIEEFVNLFKSEIKSINNLDNFEIVKGDKISKFYDGRTYVNGGGSLNKSCMRHEHCQEYFKFYEINPDKVELVILYEKENKKILGRALLWNIEDPKIKLLDRIYTTIDSDQNLFIKYAIKNGWYYKKTQRFDEEYFLTPSGEEKKINCRINLKHIEHRYFPYLDTFYFYDIKNHYITNNKKEYKENKYIVKLRSTDGREQGNENFVFDIYNNDYVRFEDTVYCQHEDCRILKKDSIILDDCYFTPYGIRFSEYDGKIYAKSDVVWSSYHKTFIDKKNYFKVYYDENVDKYDNIHIDLRGVVFEYVYNKDSYFIKDLLIKGIDDNFYLKNEYDESKIEKNKKTNSTTDLDKFFDEFMHKVSKTDTFDYGTFTSSKW